MLSSPNYFELLGILDPSELGSDFENGHASYHKNER